MHRALMVSMALLVGCAGTGRGDPLGTDPVASARLENLEFASIGVIAGFVEGDADLVYTLEDGTTYSWPVTTRGGLVGGVVDISFDPIPNTTELDLSGADDPLPASDLLGTYNGSAVSMVVGLGFQSRSLSNGAGVELDETQFALGIGVMAAFEWVKIKLDDGPDTFEDDTGVAAR